VKLQNLWLGVVIQFICWTYLILEQIILKSYSHSSVLSTLLFLFPLSGIIHLIYKKNLDVLYLVYMPDPFMCSRKWMLTGHRFCLWSKAGDFDHFTTDFLRDREEVLQGKQGKMKSNKSYYYPQGPRIIL
jgi:hypothetical protein